jgi:hypothetical protein
MAAQTYMGAVDGLILMDRITTVQVKETTRNKLRDLGKKGDSYDDIIERLLSHQAGNPTGPARTTKRKRS